MLTLSQGEQKRVWEGVLASEIRADYFGEFSGSLLAQQRWTNFSTLLVSSGAAAAIIAHAPFWVTLLLPLLSASISLFGVLRQAQKLALEAADLHDKWGRISLEFQRLWDDMYSDDAPAKLRKLEDDMSGLGKPGLSLPYRKRSMLKWQEHVERLHSAHA